MITRFIFLLSALFLLAGCRASAEPNEIRREDCTVGPVPTGLGFDPFYQKYCDAGGIPIISSAAVDDAALQQAYYIVLHMLKSSPEVHKELIANGAYFGIIGKDEEQTSLPEYQHLDSAYWDDRARGLGGSKELPITSAGEENLLCLIRDPYRGESIAVHEFAHTISLMGLGDKFEPMLEEFSQIYQAALEEGLWENTYAASAIGEYWSEGVQTYFSTNIVLVRVDGIQKELNSRQELQEYDPALYQFIDTFFNGYDWTPECP